MTYESVVRASSNNPFEWGREVIVKMAEVEEERIKKALIGSKITNIELNPIKNRKTMYELVIKTDAERVPRLEMGQGHLLHNKVMPIQESTTHFFELSEIRVRTKTRPPFRSSNTKANQDE